jgi:hypothetical protein
VRVDWLYHSIWNWELLDESSYLLEPTMIDTSARAANETGIKSQQLTIFRKDYSEWEMGAC